MPPPRFLVCYLCGQQFGSSSLAIHQKQCYVKKVKQWNNEHPSERGPRPVDPATMEAQVRAKKEAAAAAAQQRQAGGRFCKKCSEPHEPTAKFCQNCGTKLAAPPSAGTEQRAAARRRQQPPAMTADEAANYEALSAYLVPCRLCGRKFAPDRVKRHEEACKVATKPRKQYNSHKHRVQGTDMVGNQQTYQREVVRGASTHKQSSWREQHREFVSAIRNARRMENFRQGGGNVRDLPPPPPTVNSHYVQCPYCTRSFAPDTAERHIPRCKDTVARPKPPRSTAQGVPRAAKKSVGGGGSVSFRTPQPRSSHPRMREGGSLDPHSNVQTTSVIGSRGLLETQRRQSSPLPPRQDHRYPPPDPKSNVQTTSVIGARGLLETQRRQSSPLSPRQDHRHPPPDPKSNVQTTSVIGSRGLLETQRRQSSPLPPRQDRYPPPDPKSNVQTTSVIGSRALLDAQRSPRPHSSGAPRSVGGATYRNGPPPDPKSNEQTVNIFGGEFPEVKAQAYPRAPSGPSFTEQARGGGRILNSNATSSAMYAAFGR